ncbi:MAG: DUF4157 domain-containing protein, partial [Anaerolineales bacterium]
MSGQFQWLKSQRGENPKRLLTSETATHSSHPSVLGNQSAQRFVESCPHALPSPGVCPFGGACHACPARVHTKLEISRPGDPDEEEADRVAEQVMAMPEPKVQRACPSCEDETLQKKPLAGHITPLVQRQEEPEEEEGIQRQKEPGDEEEEPVHAKGEGGQSPQSSRGLDAKIQSLSGRGQPLSQPARDFFEPRFGFDFGGVRVHSGGDASEAAKAANAQAFTLGREIVFGPGRYAPESPTGQGLLAHELAHIVQQNPSLQKVFAKKKTPKPAMLPSKTLPCEKQHQDAINAALENAETWRAKAVTTLTALEKNLTRQASKITDRPRIGSAYDELAKLMPDFFTKLEKIQFPISSESIV